MSNTPEAPTPVDAALAYQARGWRVIQLHSVGPDGVTCSCHRGGNCTSKGKHPRDNEWQKNPPLSTPDIYALWDERPKANIGIATGSESGVFVVDLDPKDDGVEAFKALVAENGGEFPTTYCAQTGSGGYHYYLRMPEGMEVRNSQSKIAKGIDIRGTGGQVVAAPSRTDKGVYTVVRDVEVASAPSWLLGLLGKDQEPVEVLTAEDLPRPEDIPAEEWARLNTYTQKAVKSNLDRLDRLKVDGWNGEPWDATTFQVSAALIEIANSPWNAYSLGQAKADLLVYAPRDKEGFDDWKVTQKFESAREKVGDKVRPMPEGRPTTPAVDPLFGGPDVQDRSANPSEGGAPAGDAPRRIDPSAFFLSKEEGGGIDVELLGRAIAQMGPVGWGVDEDWWVYEGGVWKQDRKVIRRRAKTLLGRRLRRQHANEVAEYLQFDDSTYQISGDPTPKYLNFRNGMLDWKTGVMHPHDPSHRSVIQFPLDYEPDADCPAFEEFLAQVMHEDYVALTWEMLGYLLYSGNKFQVAFLLYGTGGNGKGTLTRVIQEMLGVDNIANEPLDRLNGDRFSSVNLFAKVANIAGDIDATYQESTANFKRLTGEDKLAAERKYGDRFNFENWAVPLFSANKIPGSSDVTEGYLRRWIVLHFHKRITNPKPGLSNLLLAELPGIAAKAVRALQVLMARDGFDPQGEATKGAIEFAQAIDQVRQWIASGEIQSAPDHHEPLDKLFAEYTLWAARTNRGRVNEQEFSHRLSGIGYEHTSLAGRQFHIGLKVPDRQHSVTPETFTF